MNRIFKQVATLAALMLTFVAWGCDNVGSVTQPGGLNPRGYAIFSTASGEQFVVIKADEVLGVVSGSIGSAGGELHLGAHTLIVPAGAVSEPTTFSMSRADNELVRMRLSATRVTHNDVGSAGFAAPVKLSISFAGAQDLPENVEQLKVIYFTPDGLVDPKSTWLDVVDQSASGDLDHFSDYGLGWPI